MRVLVILLLCVISAAVEDVATEAAFEVPAAYAATNYTAPYEIENALQAEFPNATNFTPPVHLASWPKNPADGRPAECWTNQALVDVGGCLGLTEVKGITTKEVCAAQCEEEPLCPSYQFSDNEGCWMGSGNKCNSARPELKNLTASRFMSGEVNVLANTFAKGIQMVGLKTVGHFTLYGNDTLPPVEEGTLRCKEYCYSNLMCQYWHFIEGAGSGKGCFVDDGKITTLTDGTLEKNVDWKDTLDSGLLAGEFIQHFCPPEPTLPPTEPPMTTTPAPATDLTWLWITLGVVGAAILAGILYYLLKPKPKVRAVKPRAVAPPPAKEPVPVYRTVIPAYGVPATSYQGTTTTYTGDPQNPTSFVVTRAA